MKTHTHTYITQNKNKHDINNSYHHTNKGFIKMCRRLSVLTLTDITTLIYISCLLQNVTLKKRLKLLVL